MASSGPWKEHVLDEIPVVDSDLGDAATCLLHTVLFTRAPGPVRPSEATCHAFPNISYSLCAVGDVSRKVEHAVKTFEESISASAHDDLDGAVSGGYGVSRNSFGSSQRLPPQAASVGSAGCLVVAFFERKIEKALFGLMSNEEKIYFEKWIVPVRVAPTPPSPAQYEAATRATEMALQHALLHILAAVQHVDHVSSKMYDFEVWLLVQSWVVFGVRDWTDGFLLPWRRSPTTKRGEVEASERSSDERES
jgi:autophagy-related protein 101